ncbi:hypothetical protein [Thalassomonas haliotis]|uniref:DUF1240 domain-containing protein n=1 Tax=Thalassomonas haliotis TaxID=485448 RepID=A0ABY7V946_9GAMM|nr:hypothetical protein [Thalassomonas haliotis]WDE09745.1 hypothetical protein H3N35_15615 [Thalassomonas haliotis]
MSNSAEYIEEPSGVKHKLIAVAIMLFFMFAAWIFISKLGSVLTNYNKLLIKSVFIEVWPLTFSVPFIVGIFGLIIFSAYLKLVGRMSQKKMQLGFKLFFVLLILAISSRIFFGWLSSYYLEKQGYSYCYFYSEHRAGTPDIWVEKADYCVENSGVVSIKVLAWISAQEAQGKSPTVLEVQKTVNDMIKNYITQK